MLKLDNRITSDELNREIFRAANEDDLYDAIDRISLARTRNDQTLLRAEVVTESAKNDRILVWMAWASFGWTLIGDKRQSGSGSYEIVPQAKRLITEAASIKHRYREFEDEARYLKYVSSCAGIPKDLR